MNRPSTNRGVGGTEPELQEAAAFMPKTSQAHIIDGWPVKPRALRKRNFLWIVIFILDVVSVLLALSFVGMLRMRQPFDFNTIMLLTSGCSSRLYDDRVRWATDNCVG